MERSTHARIPNPRSMVFLIHPGPGSDRLRDPLVASHILAGIVLWRVAWALGLTLDAMFSGGHQMFLPRVESLSSPAALIEHLLGQAGGGVIFSIGIVVVVVLMRLLVRRVWIADLLTALLLGAAFFSAPWAYQYPADRLYTVAIAYSTLWLFRHFGLLALIMLVAGDFETLPISFTSWYAGRSLMVLAIPVALAGWALWVILSAQRRPGTDSAG
jgi:hypothetical protein